MSVYSEGKNIIFHLLAQAELYMFLNFSIQGRQRTKNMI